MPKLQNFNMFLVDTPETSQKDYIAYFSDYFSEWNEKMFGDLLINTVNRGNDFLLIVKSVSDNSKALALMEVSKSVPLEQRESIILGIESDARAEMDFIKDNIESIIRGVAEIYISTSIPHLWTFRIRLIIDRCHFDDTDSGIFFAAAYNGYSFDGFYSENRLTIENLKGARGIVSVPFENVKARITFINCGFHECSFRFGNEFEASFQGCKFMDCIFDGVVEKQIRFENCTFQKAIFSETCDFRTFPIFNGSKFELVKFNGAKVNGAWFMGCDFWEITFKGSALEMSAFSGSKFDYVSFEGASLVSSNFENLSGKGLSFHDCNLTGSIFGSGIVPHFYRCVLDHVVGLPPDVRNFSG